MKVQTSTEVMSAYREGHELVPGVNVAGRVAGTFTPDRDDDPPYEVEMSAVFEDGRYVVESLTCRRVEGGQPITGDGLRQVPIAVLLAAMTSDYLLLWKDDKPGNPWVQFEGIKPEDRTGGPTDEALKKLAVVYQLNLACGLPPTKAIERSFELPRSTAGRWIALAREKGLLPTTTPSASGGTRSPRVVD